MKHRAHGYRQQADLIRALAHPTRLRILEILAESGECCVCHLTAVLKQRQPYVSQQLMVLRDKGLATDRKDGVMVYYRLADPRIRDLISLTRDLLVATDAAATKRLAMGEAAKRLTKGEAAFPAIPEPPVPGCPCPVCEAARRSPSSEAKGYRAGEAASS
jgi:ArsR family transcriptional regulator